MSISKEEFDMGFILAKEKDTDYVLDFLKQQRKSKRAFTAKDVAKAVKKGPEIVRVKLRNLVKANKIIKKKIRVGSFYVPHYKAR